MPKTLDIPMPTEPAVVPKAPAPPSTESVADIAKASRKVIYDKVIIEERSTASEKGPITEEVAIKILKWETEKQYKARKVVEAPGTNESHWTFGDEFMLKDVEGNKVRCWNNLDNREFDDRWSQGLTQTVLNYDWCGPLTVPGETINGETIRLSRTGKVLSGQHQLVGLVIACQIYRKSADNCPDWQKAGRDPVLETILVKGISEHPDVLASIDYCKPRSVADLFYTSELFRKLAPGDRREYSRMTAQDVDFMWKRTGAQGYKTHPEVAAFVERHKKIIKCVEHLFQENTGDRSKPISSLRLSPGMCSAICYLMGCSASDGEEYRNGFPPQEKQLDWSRWELAKQFWATVGNVEVKTLAHVRRALGRLMDSSAADEANQGLGGRAFEKLAVISRAWEAWVATSGDPKFTDADLAEGGRLYLTYRDHTYDPKTQETKKLPEGQVELVTRADFGGIDCPDEVGSPTPDAPKTQAELDAAAEEVRKGRAGANGDAPKPKAATAAKPAAAPVVKAPSQAAIDLAAKLKADREKKAAKK